MSDNNSYTKGFVFGAIIGGAVGAITALLLAPKSGAELRKEIADKTLDAYDKTAEYIQNVAADVAPTIENTINEGKMKAQGIVNAAKKQAEELISDADSILHSAKLKAKHTAEDLMNDADTILHAAKKQAQHTKDALASTIDNVKDATKAGVDAFKTEMKS